MVKIECYKDSFNHTHSLLELDRLKCSQAIRTLVEKAEKNYSPLAITSAVKEYATKLGLGANVRELNRKVANVKYKVRGPLEAHLICDSDLKSDISKSMSLLVEKGYRVENYRVSYQSAKSAKSARGIVFAHLK